MCNNEILEHINKQGGGSMVFQISQSNFFTYWISLSWFLVVEGMVCKVFVLGEFDVVKIGDRMRAVP